MTLDDKLDQLRRERTARARSQRIRSHWERIEAEDGLTVKEKLERLITLTAPGKPGHRPPAPVPERERARREPVQVFENAFQPGARYGQIPISLGLQVPGRILSFLSRDEDFEPLGLGSSVLLDLETTGLAGGTGTVPFLVGLGYYRDGRFKVTQFFLHEMAEEDRLIRELGSFIRDMGFRSLVTYNGKAFDLPLLETRFALHRTPCPLRGVPHLDFLFSARTLWKHKHESCRLFNLAQQVVQAERAEDIPGAEIPLRYFQYIRNGDFSLMDPVLDHNQEDLLSLLGVVVAGALLVERTLQGQGLEDAGADAMDLYGLSKLFERAGDEASSVALLEKALTGGLKDDISRHARMKLGRHFKRRKDWDKALPFWRELAEAEEDVDCFRELAMYFEHTAKDYGQAYRTALEGLALSKGRSTAAERDFEKRIERLKRKMAKGGGAGEARS